MSSRSFFLSLAERSRWRIKGGNRHGHELAARLAMTMMMKPDAGSNASLRRENGEPPTRLLIIKGEERPVLWRRLPANPFKPFPCSVGPMAGEDMLMVNLMNIGQLLAFFQEESGGLLLHAALVTRGAEGILLIGGSGSGKTTASQRIAEPWRSSCDDNVLVVREENGGYMAHPWPTWSRFSQRGAGGTWPVQEAVRLRAMFFLQPAADDVWSFIPVPAAVAALTESVEQAMWSITLPLERSRRNAVRLRRFDNAVLLAGAIPSFHLRISLHGSFWKTMEEALWEATARSARPSDKERILRRKASGLRGLNCSRAKNMGADPFCADVRKVIRAIPRGRVATYGQVAHLAGKPWGARQVAWVLHAQSARHRLPWQRVVGAAGRISLAPGRGFEEQLRRLRREGVGVDRRGRIDLERFRWRAEGDLAKKKGRPGRPFHL